MCRSIKTLREPYTEQVTTEDVQAAALQYVRKISGFRAPAAHNAEAFQAAVDAVSQATADLLDRLEVRPAPNRPAPGGAGKGSVRSPRPPQSARPARTG
ncbi:MAG TPA: DUF2277 domain-containing protein [Streptosporangiaceae bacterium]|jgi:hypothetical protein|nr:DUF2277 domain-containing protein [Streptosporangiaceae bacterium]